MDGIKAKLVGELTSRIRRPEGVLVHPNGRLYVAGAGSGNVVAYKDGRVVKELVGLYHTPMILNGLRKAISGFLMLETTACSCYRQS